MLRFYRALRSRKDDLKAKEDTLHAMILKSDPRHRALKPKPPKPAIKFGPLCEEDAMKESFFI